MVSLLVSQSLEEIQTWFDKSISNRLFVRRVLNGIAISRQERRTAFNLIFIATKVFCIFVIRKKERCTLARMKLNAAKYPLALWKRARFSPARARRPRTARKTKRETYFFVWKELAPSLELQLVLCFARSFIPPHNRIGNNP